MQRRPIKDRLARADLGRYGMGDQKRNGKGRSADEVQAERSRRMQEAVRDLPDPERRKLTREDVETLRKADLGDLAEIAERYV
jgi:hypothetical protein